MNPRIIGMLGVALLAVLGCKEAHGAASADAGGECKLQLMLGQVTSGQFVELASGDPVELVLGFQGIRMLQLSLGVDGTRGERVDVITHMSIEAVEQELDQRDRGLPLVAGDAGKQQIEDYIVFVNDVAASEAVGATARLEIIARTDGCQGTLVRELVLRDDDACVDFDVVIDAAVSGDIPDASVACGDGS